jgi:peptidoglycan/LPS O-acetylase OafA/YrhL
MSSERAGQRPVADLRVLDALRGLAAAYVVICHASALLWAGTFPATRQGPLAEIYHRLVDYSPVAVILFFVISGFCIHYRQAQRLAAGEASARWLSRGDVRKFATRRFRRLFPALALAVALTGACDLVGSHIDAAFYLGPKPDQISWLGFSHSLTTLLGNLAFQASLSVPAFGTNSPLWSLGYEFWFYALYPLLVFVSGRRGSWSMLWLAALGAGLGYGASRYTDGWIVFVLISWFVWACGALLAEAYAGRIRLPGLRWAALIAFASLPLLAKYFPYPFGGRGQPRDILWGVALVVVLAYVLIEPAPIVTRIANRLARHLAWLGEISYSLYLVHVPWLALLSAWWLVGHAGLPAGLELVVFGGISALGLGALSWYLVERHFVTARSLRAPALIKMRRTRAEQFILNASLRQNPRPLDSSG